MEKDEKREEKNRRNDSSVLKCVDVDYFAVDWISDNIY